MTPTLRTTLFAALAIPPLAGCSNFQDAIFNPPDGIAGESVLVVPFSRLDQDRWYCESLDGEMVTESFKSWVMKNGTPDFPEGRGVDQVLRLIRDWQGTEITSADWKRITATLGVTYVLYGEIEKLKLRNPKSIGLVDASLVASYRLVDVQKQRMVAWRKSFTITVSKEREMDVPIVDLGTDPVMLEKQLYVKLGQQVAKDLYGYVPEEG